MTNKLFPPITYSIQNGEPIIEGYTLEKPILPMHSFQNDNRYIKWQQSKVAVKVDGRLSSLINIEIGFTIQQMDANVNIDFLADRIEVREERILLAKSGGYREGLMIEPATFIDGKPYKVTYKAFLLLVKEDNFPNIASALRKGINPMYTIEEIEKAIDELPFSQVLRNTIKVDVINNLKK